MADKNPTPLMNLEQLNQLLDKDGEQLKPLLQEMMNEILNAGMDECLKVLSHERTGERQGYRSGYYSRRLITRFGPYRADAAAGSCGTIQNRAV